MYPSLSSRGLSNEVVHKRRSVARRSALALSTKLLVEKEALKDCVSREGEYAHEDSSNQISNDASDDAWEVRRGSALHYLGPFGHLEIGDRNCEANDEEAAKEHEDASD